MQQTRAGYVAAARCLALDALAAAAVTALRDRGIDSVLLKGPATVHWLYADDPASRRYTDIDLLVRPDRYAPAGTVLAELGMVDRLAGLRRSEADRLHEQQWITRTGLMLELHRSFFEVADGSAFWTAVRDDAQQLVVAGTEVAIPGPAAAALICALHVANHGRERALSRKPLADLARAVTIFDDATWREAAARAERLNASAAFIAGLSMNPDGAQLVRRLALSATMNPRVSVRLAGRERRGDLTIAAVLSTRDRSAQLRHVRDMIFPSPTWLAFGIPWARRSRLLLPAAYVFRWARQIVLAPHLLVRVAVRIHRAAPRRRPANRSAWSAAMRFLRRPSRQRLHAARWTAAALREVRAQLHDTPVDQIRVPPLPAALGGDAATVQRQLGTVRWTLHFRRASCLESCLVRQCWLAAAGRPVDLVIGVAGSSTEFRAHAWLAGERGTDGFSELARYPAPRD